MEEDNLEPRALTTLEEVLTIVRDMKEHYKAANAVKGPTSERATLIGLITDLTNKSRLQAKYAPWKASYVAVKLSFLKTPALKDHFYQCYKNEVWNGGRFWGLLRVK